MRLLQTICLLVPAIANASAIGSGFAYAFSSGVGSDDVSYLYIDGPLGRESFRFGILTDAGTSSAVINSYGLFVAVGEATEDQFLYYAQYGLGGAPDANINDTPSLFPYDNFGRLVLSEVSSGDVVYYSKPTLQPDGEITGTVVWRDWSDPTPDSGYILRTDAWSFGGPQSIDAFATFTPHVSFAPIAAPEPGTFALIGGALLWLILRGRKWHYARTASPQPRHRWNSW